MVIIPKKYDAAKVRLKIKKEMAEHGEDSILVPELTTLYDIALDLAGVGKGAVIMMEDFFCLLDQIEGLPQKYKKNNRNYKSAVFSLLNQMAFEDEDLAHYPFRGTVEAAGLTRELCKKIYDVVRKKGFMFRAEIYRKALAALDEHPATDEFTLIPGEYYTRLEQELLAKLKVKISGKNKTSPELTSDRMGFLKASSIMEQYTAVKNHILAQMALDKNLDYDDFCVVVGTDESLARCAAYYSAAGFHCISSASVPKENVLLDNLNLISYAIGEQTEKLVLYYNRHNPDDMVFCDANYEFSHLTVFCKKLRNTKYDSVSDNFKRWIGRYEREIFKENNPMKEEKAESILNHLQEIFEKLGMARYSLYEYEESVKKVFGNTKITLYDLVRYFRNILVGRKKNLISPLDDGVVLVKIGEYIPPCKNIYFLDLEDETFLKDNASNHLLTREEHDEFNRSVYGLTKEQHLEELFDSAVAAAGHVLFVIPQYNEGTVISEYVEDLLLKFSSKKCNVQILGGDEKSFEHDFPLTFDDIEFENAEPFRKCHSDGNLHFGFEVRVDEKKESPLDFVLSRIGTPTKVEAFMSCPARFVYEHQLPDNQLSDETIFDKGNALHEFCKKVFSCRISFCSDNLKAGDLDRNIADYILGNPCDIKMQKMFDRADVKKIFASVKENYPDIELNNQDFFKYLKFICRAFWKSSRENGPLYDAVPDSFRTEVFIGNADILKQYGIKIAEGYIDLLFKNRDGSIALLDYKTGNISKYSDDVKNCQNVQLLLYSYVVQNALKNGDMSVFNPAGDQLEKAKKRGCTILGSDYFDDVDTDADVCACYVSPKGGDTGFACVSGIDSDVSDPFAALKDRLGVLLHDAESNIFSAYKSSKCDYCAAYSFCSVANQSNSISEFYKKLDWQGPYIKDFPVPEKDVSGHGDDTKRIICFDKGDKMEAITNTVDDIIISAGAGAGKTEVLTSRYLNLLLNTDASLDNILCITFTDKAAGEMKKRIFKKIKETLTLGRFYSVPDIGPLSKNQIDKLADVRKNFFRRNRISTFHSFCLDMLKKYEKEDSDSKRDLISAVADNYVIRDKKIEIFTRLIEDCRKYPVFAKWIEYQKIYLKWSETEVGLVPNFIELLNTYKLSGLPLDKESGDFLSSHFEVRKQRVLSVFKEQYEKNKQELLGGLRELLDLETEKRRKTGIEKEIANISADIFGSDTRVIYSENAKLRELLISLRENPVKAPEGLTDAEQHQLHDAIFEILMKADSQIENYKLENGFIELSDYHLDFIRLLKIDSIRERIKKSLKFIMVDEFQDTNWLQKRILDALHDDDNRLFIVGDLKQSIYRFQQCDNQIFRYYRQHGKMKYLTFCENFRSVSDIVDFNNAYFSQNQTAEYNIIEKGEKAISVKKSNPISVPAVSFVEVGCTENSAEEISKADKHILIRLQEAAFIARTISVSGKENYGRWGILIRSYSHADVIIDALNRLGIPYSFIIKKDFFTQSAVVQVIHILKVIYGYSSPSVLLPMPELSDIAKSIDLEMISRGFCYVVSRIIAHKRFVSVYSILEEFLIKCRELAKKSSENIEDIFCELQKMTDENSGEISTSLPNSVKIMTVHSSKGLEFDYLFLSKITSSDNDQDKSAPLKFVNLVSDSDEPIVDFTADNIKTLDGENRRFIYAKWMQDVNREFESTERGNLLYVALTRAKRHLIVTVQKDSLDEKTVESGVSWYRNILGNIFEPKLKYKRYNMFKIPVENIEPLSGSDYAKSEYPYEMLDLRPPKLLTVSVSSYLDFLESDCEPESDYKISDDEENAEYVKANEVGTLVHSFFEKNIHDLHNADSERFELPKSDAVRKQFLKYVNAGLKNREFLVLVDGADALFTERAMIFRNQSGNLLNGVIDLVVKKDNTLTVLDYKTHKGSELDEAALDRYRRQVRLYAYGLSRLPEFKGFKIDCCLLLMFSDGMSKMIKVS